jgi:hypothetical protein
MHQIQPRAPSASSIALCPLHPAISMSSIDPNQPIPSAPSLGAEVYPPRMAHTFRR